MGLAKEIGGLGFRDFKSFKLAMLAKQSWRMLKNPKSLPAKAFKQKYYPQRDLFEATLRNRLSYVWRSVIARQ